MRNGSYEERGRMSAPSEKGSGNGSKSLSGSKTRLPEWQTGGARKAACACLMGFDCPDAAGLAQDLSRAHALGRWLSCERRDLMPELEENPKPGILREALAARIA